ncbi:regulatory LuxR family protein [Marinoscillum furvescens DSM 4134]|uniref:Regulatory LuxR family protein n=2 Tax=Marinoscillum furvescens TaxID=1026 RepID=A0A3D9L0X5_MARFU|nr:regulatory LuxR family protein [Marinoscillum furvescens DSM 4134]
MMLYAQHDTYGFSKIPVYTTFQTSDYQGGIQNWDLIQDQRGFVYVANNFGLLEYDGNEWRKYEVQNNTRVRSVYVDETNRVYVGGQNQFGYFAPDSSGTLTFSSIYDSLTDQNKSLEDIWKITRYEDEIWFCSYLGIIGYDGKKARMLPRPFEYGLAFNVANKMYVYAPEHGLAEFNGQTFQVIPNTKRFGDNQIKEIIPHQNGNLLIFLEDGHIFKFSNGKLSPWSVAAGDFLKEALINKVLLLQNNQIAIGTQNNGILILDSTGKSVLHLTKDRGLGNRTVLALHEDQFQNLWVGLNNGISMVELASPFSIIDEQSGLPGTGYCAGFFGNTLYLGTSNGLFKLDAHPDPIAESRNYELIPGSGGQVYNIQQINNSLLLGHHSGAFEIINDQAVPFYDVSGTWKFEKIPHETEILAGTYDGFLQLNTTSSGSRHIELLDDFRESSRVFEFYNDSVIFMTHGYKGVYRLTYNTHKNQFSEVKYYGDQSGFPSNILINVFDLGNELVFPAATGIFSYDSDIDRFVHHQKLEKWIAPNQHVREMTSDIHGNIYYLTDQELGILEKNNFGSYQKRSAEFSRILKYVNDDLENITVIDHQNVFIGAKEGFIHYNPSKNYNRDQSFQTYLRHIEAVTDSAIIVHGGADSVYVPDFSLPAYFSSLKFKYATPYFDGQEDLLYQYKLENFDKDWSDWTEISEKEYTNLSQGTYTFHVRAKNVFGVISEPAVFTFTVYPPWYQSRLAYLIYASVLVLIFAISMFILDKRHRQKHEILAELQKHELQKKDSQLQEVSKKSEQEITKLRNDKLRAEIDHKNRELATTTMHLINKNEFMLTIRESIKDLAKNGSKDVAKKLIRDIDRNMSEDEGWEQFTKHFDQVHGDFLSNIKKDHPTLTPQEIKLCAYLRMNMTSKEIANLLNISVRGVEISRYRLRKKLNLTRDTNLVDYMLEYDQA